MRIAVNTRFLLKNKLEGIGWFTYETLKRLVLQHPEHEFYFLFDRPYDPSFIFAKNVTPVVLFPPARHAILWYLWFEWSVPRALKKINPDIFLSTDGYLSLKTKVPTVMVVHDLAFEHYPEMVSAFSSKYYRHFSPLYCKKATHIITVSEASKKDIETIYGISPTKITVAHNGINPIFKAISECEKNAVREKYGNGKNYFVYVGSLHPRKNIARLLKAFDVFKKNTSADTVLIIAGARGWQLKEIDEVYHQMRFKNDVIFTGHLNSEELVKIVASADAMVYVSLFEGFGIPVAEAMKCNVPVITSSISSMPEVAGNAALLVNPLNVEEIANAMTKIYSDKTLANDLIEKGKVQCQQFNWDNTATVVWKTILEITNKNVFKE
jgi:glycosyltransferase involved in cell wall biosynthesis